MFLHLSSKRQTHSFICYNQNNHQCMSRRRIPYRSCNIPGRSCNILGSLGHKYLYRQNNTHTNNYYSMSYSIGQDSHSTG